MASSLQQPLVENSVCGRVLPHGLMTVLLFCTVQTLLQSALDNRMAKKNYAVRCDSEYQHLTSNSVPVILAFRQIKQFDSKDKFLTCHTGVVLVCHT